MVAIPSDGIDEQAAAVDLEQVHLEKLRDIARRIIDYTASFPFARNARLEPKQAAAGITWVIGLVEDAIRRGDRPES